MQHVTQHKQPTPIHGIHPLISVQFVQQLKQPITQQQQMEQTQLMVPPQIQDTC